MSRQRILNNLFGSKASMVYLAIFAIAIGVATFIENDFGTSAAQKWVYRAKWFELLLVLFSGALIWNVISFKLIQRKRWAVAIFHLAVIIILVGAAVTRYAGYEGVMHIREGKQSNHILSAETHLNMTIEQDGLTYEIHEPILVSSLGGNSFTWRGRVGNTSCRVDLLDVIPNPVQSLEAADDGSPMLHIVTTMGQGRQNDFLGYGERTRIGGQMMQFSNLVTTASGVQFVLQDGRPFVTADETLISMVMASQTTDTIEAGELAPLTLATMYASSQGQFVVKAYEPEGHLVTTSTDRKIRNNSLVGLTLQIQLGDHQDIITVQGHQGIPGKPGHTGNDDIRAAIDYGAKIIELPFSLGLRDFQIERYPGTNSPSSYASEVTLMDPSVNLQRDERIYMNHILDYRGFRFFQSSFDNDELGTYLSVNHDWWGTWITYIGYILLTLGMFWTLFTSNSRFADLAKRVRKSQAGRISALVAFMTLASTGLNAQSAVAPDLPTIDEGHAQQYSEIIVQDIQGRMKPMHTLNRELMRKVHGRESFEGLNADQVCLSIFAFNADWYSVPFIKVSREESVQELLGVTGKYAAFKDFFNQEGRYKLSEEVSRANGLDPADRGMHEKGIIAVDERVNIMNMMLRGGLMKVMPLPGDANNTWVSNNSHGADNVSDVAEQFFPMYAMALRNAVDENNFTLANDLLTELNKYQKQHGASVVPSDAQRRAEIALNESSVFNRLASYYSLIGVAFLVLLFRSVFFPNAKTKWAYRILLGMLILCFAAHTAGLGVRWYISGRAPWSNGYESMIYIGWTATLAGLLFTRKSLGGLAATNVLSGVILAIAMLSNMNPEITPLQPVLRSYWLTIHVSLEAGSYGFLLLGAVIGLINLILMSVASAGRAKRIRDIVKELSNLSEITLIAGLFMLSVGTYLGGVWANESWGRYWGWDAKETWALVSILVYAFILHMRLIPGLKGLFAFNVATLFGLSSVIMTYFGVNYYLSGLHSYASGDPIPMPTWVYLMAVGFFVISVIASMQAKKHRI